ncbi:hypothetical protein [Celerinatantimonas sp. MCCC 1A17872]|uniref:hypothetical protein n=1 Tax=Celerinatantimonas sp. MCCC 1A17872 TaxID=3177514 RepID=UPI0038C99412
MTRTSSSTAANCPIQTVLDQRNRQWRETILIALKLIDQINQPRQTHQKYQQRKSG